MKLISLILLFPILSHASFDYSVFQGRFEMTTDCLNNGTRIIKLVNDAVKHEVYADLGNGWTTFNFEEINQGRKTFNSCWSDGLIGYSETIGEGQKIISKTIYKNPGFFCQGGFEKERLFKNLGIKGNTLIYESGGRGLKSSHCVLKRLVN